MSEDNDSSDHRLSSPQSSAPADEAFVVSRALERFGTGVLPALIVVGPGDDAAVLDFGAPEYFVDSCDCAVEGVHFRREWLGLAGFDHPSVGARAVICAASDITAMGASPKTVLVSAGLPSGTEKGVVEALFDGVEKGCKSVGAAVTGGNVSSAPFIFLDIKVTGETVGRAFVRNRGAESGDGVFITGELGGSEAVVCALDEMLSLEGVRPDPSVCALIENFCFPSARTDVGLALCGGAIPSAMTDVSDGLFADLGRVVSLSGAGADIFLEKIPVSSAFRDGARGAIVAGGDYELVFTAPPGMAEKITEVSDGSHVKITEIGRVTDSGAVKIFDSAGEVTGSFEGPGGYLHNGKK